MTWIIVGVFIIGLILFIGALPKIIKSAKEGWKEGKPKK